VSIAFRIRHVPQDTLKAIRGMHQALDGKEEPFARFKVMTLDDGMGLIF
jgi:hypothetical protein